jgi:nitronate monooxygenase
MVSVATPELAAAVSEAGGLGALGSGMLPADELRRQVGELRERTARPFQLNFFCHERPELPEALAARAREYFVPVYDELGMGDPPQPSSPAIEFDAERLAALLELRPPVASFHFGIPGADALAAIRDAGIKVLAPRPWGRPSSSSVPGSTRSSPRAPRPAATEPASSWTATTGRSARSRSCRRSSTRSACR